MNQTQPANWYPDPEGNGGLRYWDGTQWTDQRAPGPSGAAKKRRGRGCLTIIGAAVVLLILIGIIAAIAGSGSSKPSSDTGGVSKGITAGGSTDPVHEVKITSCANDPTLQLLDIKGTAKNDTSKRSDFAIDLAVTSADGKTQVTTTVALAPNVEPGQTALWDAPATVEIAPGQVCKVVTVQRTASI